MSQRLALIIGNSAYQDSTLSRLLTPDADVGALGEILLDQELGGFDDVNVIVNMSSHIIRREIAAFFSKKTREDLLVLYFSGHGVLDDQGHLYLAVRDTDSKLLRGTAISANYITQEMNNSRSQRQVLVLDCCHSGAFARGSKGKTGASVGTAPAFEGSGYGRVVLTASDATQYAWEGDQVIGEAQNSLFTHYLLRGIKNGEADFNGDGHITVDELYDYVYTRVIRQTPKQTPGKWSYKEQGEIVIAQAAAVERREITTKTNEFDPGLEERLEKLYHEGLSAFWLKEWDKAVDCFQAIVEARPDYPDAAEKLELSRRKKRLHTLSERTLEAEAAGDWPSAIARLEELLAIEPDYEGAARRLEEAKRERLLADLYAQAGTLSQAGKWQAVVSVFAQLHNLAPDYPDPQGLLPAAQAQVAELERQAKLESTYNRALMEMDAGHWAEAETLLAKLQEMEPEYRSTSQLLERAREEKERQQQARQTAENVSLLYQQALWFVRGNQWAQALDTIAEIRALDPEFEDREGVAENAEAELERQEQEAQRQKQLAETYAAAVNALEAGGYQQALELWADVQTLDPEYPDRKRVQKTARKKLAAPAKPGPKVRISPLAGFGVIIVLLIVAAVAVGAYFLREKPTSFYTDFSASNFNEDDWEMIFFDPDPEESRNQGGAKRIIINENSMLEMSVQGKNHSLSMTPTQFHMYDLTDPMQCETSMHLNPVAGDVAVFLTVFTFRNGVEHKQFYCSVSTGLDEDGHWFKCYAPGQGLVGISKAIPRDPKNVRIELRPEDKSIKFQSGDDIILSKEMQEDLWGDQFSCFIEVKNIDPAGDKAVGYFDHFAISPIDE